MFKVSGEDCKCSLLHQTKQQQQKRRPQGNSNNNAQKTFQIWQKDGDWLSQPLTFPLLHFTHAPYRRCTALCILTSLQKKIKKRAKHAFCFHWHICCFPLVIPSRPTWKKLLTAKCKKQIMDELSNVNISLWSENNTNSRIDATRIQD